MVVVEQALVKPITIPGYYIIDGYDNNKNDWHYVTIEIIDSD